MNLMLHEQAVLNDSAEQALSCTSLSLSVLLTAVVSRAGFFFTMSNQFINITFDCSYK